MKKYITFYLDESGNNSSEFFVVGGFYIASEDHNILRRVESKIKSNILKTEKSIKLYRAEFEKDFRQFGPIKQRQREVKWNELTTSNKTFLFEKIRSLGQTNVSISCNLKKWKSANNRIINLDANYNMMTYYLLNRTLSDLKLDFNDEIIVKIFVDQRRNVPKVFNKDGDIIKNNRLDGLETYISTQMYSCSKFKDIKISVRQLDSKVNPLIRYSDYHVGLISSMCRCLNNSAKTWDNRVEDFYKMIHKKIPCFCYYTISNQCKIISNLCLLCRS